MVLAGREAYTAPREASRPVPAREAAAGPRPRWPPRAPELVTAALGLLLWRIFFPGLLSPDSISVYEQAVTGRIHDWHPPLMAVVLRLTLGAGGGLGLLMLAQCLAGVFGVTRFAEACARALRGEALPPARARWIGVGVLGLLLLPATPLAFYLMTFWKDVWALVALLWLAALTLELELDGAPPRRIAAGVALAAILGLARHNAVVLLPLAGLALAFAAGARGRRRWLALAAAPLALYLVANAALRRAFDVAETHTEDAVMTLELVGLCAESRAVCRELPWTARHILRRDLLEAGYRPGDMVFVYFSDPKPVDLAMARDHERLKAEYLAAARRFPSRLLRLKVRAWAAMLDPSRTYYFFHTHIVDNPYGLHLAARFAGLREWLTRTVLAVAERPVLRWLSAVHLVWLLANLAWVLALLARWRRSRSRPHLLLALLLLLPLGYYLSYLVATPVHDFRFLYPATVAVQCLTLSALLALPGGGVQKPTGRAP